MLEYIFIFDIYSITEYIAPIKLAKNNLKCFIFIFEISPVAYKII